MSDTSSSFEKRGVSLRLMRSVRDFALQRNGDKKVWTIAAISARIVGNHEIMKLGNRWGDVDASATLTYESQTSLIELLQIHHRDANNVHPELGVYYNQVVSDKPNIFLSYAYSSNYIDLVEAIEVHFEENPDLSVGSTYFWFDLFVNNQWYALDKDFTWWSGTFRSAVKGIGNTLCFFDSWDKAIYVTRAWTLYELVCSENIHLTLSRDQVQVFHNTLRRSVDEVISVLCAIDLEKADCFVKEDKTRIFEVVCREGGFYHFNAKITNLLRNWITKTAKQLVSRYQFSSVEETFTIEQLQGMCQCANLLQKEGYFKEAKEIYLKILSNYEKQLGFRHPDTVLVHIDLANLLYEEGRLEDATEMYSKVSSTYDLKHPEFVKCFESVMSMYCNWTAALMDQGNHKLAKDMYLKLLPYYDIELGSEHPYTLNYYSNLAIMADLAKRQGHIEESTKMFEKALSGYEEFRVPGHLGSLRARNNLARLLTEESHFEEANEMCLSAKVVFEKVLGPEHSDTRKAGELYKLIQDKLYDNWISLSYVFCGLFLMLLEGIVYFYLRKLICR